MSWEFPFAAGSSNDFPSIAGDDRAAIDLLAGAGLWFVRHLRWRPLETLCASVTLSLFLLYLAASIIYGLEVAPAWSYAPTVLSVVAAIACRSDLRRLWHHRETRSTVLAFPVIFLWLVLLLLLVRNYSGGRWYGDWYEHYERAMFFADHFPLYTKLFGNYLLPARPPMMNLLTALLFWQVAPRFELFQVSFAFMNALVLLPCALIAPSLIARTRNRAWLIAGFLALNPMFVQNSVYTWTKLFAAFYSLTALGLYLSAWRRNDSPRIVAAFACLATAMIVHYSAAPLVLFLGAHYVFVLFRRRHHRWRELIVSAAVGAAIMFTWLGWSFYAYGWKDTVGSNTTVTGSQNYSLVGNLGKIAENTFDTLVPFPLRGRYENDASYDPHIPQRGLAYLRDWFFCIYQTSFPAMLGLGGLILVIWLLGKLWIRPPKDPWQHHYVFWILCILVVAFIGIALVGSVESFGIAHICLQPLVLIGLTYAAIGLPHVPLTVRGLALLGLLIDAAFGVLLHIHLLRNTFDISPAGDQLKIGSHIEMGRAAIANGVTKFQMQAPFLGDQLGTVAGAIVEAIVVVCAVAICAGLWLLASRGQGRHDAA